MRNWAQASRFKYLCLFSILWSDKGRCGWERGAESSHQMFFCLQMNVAINIEESSSFRKQWSSSLNHWLPFRHLFQLPDQSHNWDSSCCCLWPSDWHPSQYRDGSGPTTQGSLWCSELTFDEETRKPEGFHEEYPGVKWTVLLFRCL